MRTRTFHWLGECVVIYDIVHVFDFMMHRMGRVLSLLDTWRREHLRFVLVYDAGENHVGIDR